MLLCWTEWKSSAVTEPPSRTLATCVAPATLSLPPLYRRVLHCGIQEGGRGLLLLLVLFPAVILALSRVVSRCGDGSAHDYRRRIYDRRLFPRSMTGAILRLLCPASLTIVMMPFAQHFRQYRLLVYLPAPLSSLPRKAKEVPDAIYILSVIFMPMYILTYL